MKGYVVAILEAEPLCYERSKLAISDLPWKRIVMSMSKNAINAKDMLICI